ncbi:MAG: cysteine synthase family protein [Candidatus Aenigmarchaeota archaeon]|nr:cysteine synthase family protein [Candidatus Aenigmarchaeota archaeon]
MHDILSRIGNTPVLDLSFVSTKKKVKIFAKAEWCNPGGSVKDRPAARMVLEGIESGKLTKNKTIIDATSGNTGIAYAMIGAALGYKVKLCLPENASEERKKILKAYGANLVLTSGLEGTDGAIKEAKKLFAESPENYFYPDQYNNPENWKAHYFGTAEEIWKQTKGKLTHFVSGVGTSGTFVGCGKRFRELNSKIKLIEIQPDSPFHGLEGLKHMESAIVPGIYNPNLADKKLEIKTENAYKMVKLFAKKGLLIGISSGAAISACIKLSEELDDGLIVTILPDSADKYLSEKFWDE